MARQHARWALWLNGLRWSAPQLPSRDVEGSRLPAARLTLALLPLKRSFDDAPKPGALFALAPLPFTLLFEDALIFGTARFTLALLPLKRLVKDALILGRRFGSVEIAPRCSLLVGEGTPPRLACNSPLRMLRLELRMLGLEVTVVAEVCDRIGDGLRRHLNCREQRDRECPDRDPTERVYRQGLLLFVQRAPRAVDRGTNTLEGARRRGRLEAEAPACSGGRPHPAASLRPPPSRGCAAGGAAAMYVDHSNRRVVRLRRSFLNALRAAWWSDDAKKRSGLGSHLLDQLEPARAVVDELASAPLAAVKGGADPGALIDLWAENHRLGHRTTQELEGGRLASRRRPGAAWIVGVAENTLRMWASFPTEYRIRRWDYGSVSMVPYDEGDDFNATIRGWRVDEEALDRPRRTAPRWCPDLAVVREGRRMRGASARDLRPTGPRVPSRALSAGAGDSSVQASMASRRQG